MKAYELFEALTDLDDELLMKAESAPKKSYRVQKMGLRAALIAATVSMLTATVVAISVSVKILRSEEFVSFYDYLDNSSFYWEYASQITTIDFELEEQNMDIPVQWSDQLTQSWENFVYDHQYFTGVDVTDGTGNRMAFESIGVLGDFLDCHFTTSDQLDGLIQGVYITMVVTDTERAAQEYQAAGCVTPDGLAIYCVLSRGGETGLNADIMQYSGLTIYLPCTQSFARQYANHSVLSSVQNEEFEQGQYITSGNVKIMLVQNRSLAYYQPTGYAAWCEGGIGYLLEARCYRNAAHAPLEMILPYLENLK